MNGGSSAPYLACTPCVPLFVHCSIRVEAEGLLDYQGRAGIISIVRWNLRPVIFGVDLSAPKSRRFLRFAIAMPIDRGPQKSQRFPKQDKAMLHCDLRARWQVTSDLRFRAAMSEPKTPSSSFCGISGELAPSTRKSLAIAIVRFWCAKTFPVLLFLGGGGTWVRPPPRGPPRKPLLRVSACSACVCVLCALCLRSYMVAVSLYGPR